MRLLGLCPPCGALRPPVVGGSGHDPDPRDFEAHVGGRGFAYVFQRVPSSQSSGFGGEHGALSIVVPVEGLRGASLMLLNRIRHLGQSRLVAMRH